MDNLNPSFEPSKNTIAIQAIDPKNGKITKVYLSSAKIASMRNRGSIQTKELGYIVPEILLHPTAIFEGIRCESDEDNSSKSDGWRCYCGVPSRSFRKDGTENQPYPNKVFLVFINREGFVYSWRWEIADSEHPKLVHGYNDRFRERLL